MKENDCERNIDGKWKQSKNDSVRFCVERNCSLVSKVNTFNVA